MGNADRDEANEVAWRELMNESPGVPGVSGEIIESKDKAYYPTMKVVWDPNKIGITAGQIGKQLLEGEPRIMTHAGLSNQ
jgi:hypothetical protein